MSLRSYHVDLSYSDTDLKIFINSLLKRIIVDIKKRNDETNTKERFLWCQITIRSSKRLESKRILRLINSQRHIWLFIWSNWNLHDLFWCLYNVARFIQKRIYYWMRKNHFENNWSVDDLNIDDMRVFKHVLRMRVVDRLLCNSTIEELLSLLMMSFCAKMLMMSIWSILIDSEINVVCSKKSASTNLLSFEESDSRSHARVWQIRLFF